MAALEVSLVLDILFHTTSLHCASLVYFVFIFVAVSVALLKNRFFFHCNLTCTKINKGSHNNTKV